MIIAIDFDGTIVEHAYRKSASPFPAIETLQMLRMTVAASSDRARRKTAQGRSIIAIRA